MMSCQSVRVDYEYVVPELNFPIFPSLDRKINEDGSWTIPKNSIDLLSEYYLNIQKTEKDYNEIKSLYEEVQK